jgi:hypothetical protein
MPGLPDSSWHNIPKRWKIYQITTTLPHGHKICISNDRKIFQMTIKYTSIFHSKALQNWDFWFENTPSGNPDLYN